jgi:hypothetical protein
MVKKTAVKAMSKDKNKQIHAFAIMKLMERLCRKNAAEQDIYSDLK